MRWLFLFVLVLNFAYVAWELNQPPEIVVSPAVSRDVPKLVLISEIGQDEIDAPSDMVEPVPAQNVEGAAVASGGCYTLGPFRELEKLRLMTRAIKEYVADASFRSHEEREQAMFWVYLKPAKSYDKAKALTDQLKKKKVKDYFIVKSGPKNNGVSLGHFREKDRAYAHAAHIISMGFKPEVEVLFKEYTIYWLDYEVVSGKAVPEKVFKKHISGNINRLARACS